MSKNTPYEQDSGILSTIVGTATLAGLSYGAWSAVTDPTGTERTMRKVFDRVFPMTTSTPDAYQSMSMQANKTITSTDWLAAQRRAASFDKRRQDIGSTLDTLDVHAATPGVKVKNKIQGVKGYQNWGYKDVADFDAHVETFVGKSKLGSPAQRVQNVMYELTGGLRSGISFSGTTMNMAVDGNEFALHFPKWNGSKGVKSFIAKENGNTMRIHKIGQAVRYGRNGDGNIFVKGIDDPFSNVLRILEDPMELMAYANKKGDDGRTSKRIWDAINGKSTGSGNPDAINTDWINLSYKDKMAEIKRTAKALGVDKYYKTELSKYDIQDVFTNITREQGQWIPENDKIGMDYFGKQAQIDWWNMVKYGDDSTAIQLRRINGLATKGDDIERFYEQIPGATQEYVSKLKNGLVKKALFKGAEFGWTTNQTQIAERVMGTIPSVGAFQTAEMFKARARGYESRIDAAASKTAFGRVSPLIRNKVAESYAGNLLNKDLHTLGVVTVLDPTISDVTLLRPEIAKDFYSAKAHTYTLNKLATSKNEKAIKTSITAIYEGKEQEYKSLQHFLEEAAKDSSVLDGIKKIDMAGNTTLGVGAGNDLLTTVESVSMARELAEQGNPITAHTRFEMGKSEISSMVDSWNEFNNGTGGHIKVSGRLISMTSKAGDPVIDSRYAMGSIDFNQGHSIDGLYGDVKIRNYAAEERVKAIVDGMKADHHGLVKKYGISYDQLDSTIGTVKTRLDQLKELKNQSRLDDKGFQTFMSLKQHLTDLKEIQSSGAQLDALGNIAPMYSHVDGRTAFDLYKHVIPVNEVGHAGSQIRAGKGAPGYLTFLEYALTGHMGAKDQSFSGEAIKEFAKVANLGAHSINPIVTARSLIGDSEFYFNEHIGSEVSKTKGYAEHINVMERFVATSRRYGKGATIDKLLSTDESKVELDLIFKAFKESKDGRIADAIKGDNAFYMWQQLFPHENEAMTQGRGFNIFRVGLKEQALFNGIEGTLAYANIFNTVDTTSIYKQGKLLEETMSAKLGDSIDLRERGVKIIESEKDFMSLGTEGFMEHVLAEDGKSNLRNPEVMLNTIFGSDKFHKDGIGIKYDMGEGKTGTLFVGTGSFQGMNQYLGDSDSVTLTETNHASFDLIKNARDRNGIASKEAAETYILRMLGEHGQGTKGGYKKYGARHIELTSYSRNLNDHKVIGNKSLMSFLEKEGAAESKALRNVLGHSVYMSERAYKSTVEKHVSEIGDAIQRSGLDRVEGSVEIFGANSTIGKMLKRGANATQIAEQMAEESMTLAKKVSSFATRIHEAGSMTAQDLIEAKELVGAVKSNSTSAFLIRHPILYPGSGSGAYLFAMDQKTIGDGKEIMAGDLLNSLMKADFDGDKIGVIMDLMETNRANMHERIDKTQKYSTEVLEMMGQKELLRPAAGWTNAIEENIVAAGNDAQKLAEATQRIANVDTALASYMTKGLTGSADIHTHGIVSDLLTKAKGKLTPAQMEEYSAAVGTFIPWNMVQKSISSKHLERMIEGDGLTRMERMFSNIGGITKADFHANIRANEGELSLLDIFTLADISKMAKPGSESSAWIEDGMKHYDTLYRSQFHLTDVKQGEFVDALKHVGYEENVALENWNARAAKFEQLAAEGKDIRPLVDRVSAFEELGKDFGLMDIINPIRRDVREQLNPATLISQALKRRAGDKNYSILDALREAADGIVSSNLGYKNKMAMEGITGDVGLISKRSLIGLQETIEFTKKHLLSHPTRMIGMAGMAMAGVTAINMLFGDATPQSPNDLPSVNNPSFRDNRYGNMSENRQLNNVPNANVSSGLLTDSYNSYDSISNHLQSSFGNHYSSVSVRHDGQDPYKEHMMRYNM